MNNMDVIKESHELSIEGKISFPEYVKRLKAVGVRSYSVDLIRMQKIVYFENGGTHEQPFKDISFPIAREFKEKEFKSALTAVQSGEIEYLEFLERSARVGIMLYFVFFEGKKVMYLGHDGEAIIEHFPV